MINYKENSGNYKLIAINKPKNTDLVVWDNVNKKVISIISNYFNQKGGVKLL